MNIKKISLIAAAIFIVATAYSQEQPGIRDKALRLYNQYQYSEAIIIYEKIVAKKPFLQDLEKLANSYKKINDYESAEKWYSKVVQYPKSKPENLLAYAEILKTNGKYLEAKKVYSDYLTRTGLNTENAITGCDSALIWTGHPTRHKVVNEETINDSLSQFSVFINKDKIYYTSELDNKNGKTYGWTGRSFLRVFNATKSSLDGLVSSGLSDIFVNNSAYHVGSLISNQEGNKLILTKTSSEKPKDLGKTGTGKLATRVLELYFYSKDGAANWVETPFKYNSGTYSVGHAALSPDSKILYYVSDMPGGFGGTDIWFSELQSDGSWGKPQNCGSTINTQGDEEFPTISEDILHFSSTGLIGMGGLDIFKSRGNRTVWEKPVNLKYPINSSADDFGFQEIKNALGSTGYLSSNRKGGKGSDDIYSFAYTKGNDMPLTAGAISHLKDGDRSQVINNDGESNSNHSLLAKKVSYLLDSMKSSAGTRTSDALVGDLYLEPLLVNGKTLQLDNIFYDLGKDNIKAEAALVLNGLEEVLRENSSLKVKISSHTDSRGNDLYNLALSQRRAQSVVNYLVSQGISKERMIPKGYGETRLINKCGNKTECTDEENQKNRRTEFTIFFMKLSTGSK